MRLFKWTKKYDCGKSAPIVWVSDKRHIHKDKPFSAVYIKATVTSRINGPGTVFASVVFSVEYASNTHWGLDFNKHFKGPRAWMIARQWCNHLLNYPPDSWREWQLEVGK